MKVMDRNYVSENQVVDRYLRGELTEEQCADFEAFYLSDQETLAELEVEDAFELTGLYQGVALTEKSVMDIATEPDTVWLYRRPILEEWAERGDVTLAALVAHVLIHEIAHHFGYSDDDIAAIDDWRL